MPDQAAGHTRGNTPPEDGLQIFLIMDELTNEHPRALDEPFPEQWTDPLELYGCYQESLENREMDLTLERDAIRDLMKEDHYSPAAVWHSRLGLVAERIITCRH